MGLSEKPICGKSLVRVFVCVWLLRKSEKKTDVLL